MMSYDDDKKACVEEEKKQEGTDQSGLKGSAGWASAEVDDEDDVDNGNNYDRVVAAQVEVACKASS